VEAEMTNVLPHLLLRPGDLPGYVLVPGDPKRAERIAESLDGAKQLAANREYHSYRGAYRGVPVGVVSAGVGAAGAVIAYEEAIRAGANTLVRVGTAGSLSDEIVAGDLVIVLGAARGEGVSRQLVPIEMPAIADTAVSAALWAAAGEDGGRTHRGIGLTVDAFYRGVLDLGFETYAAAGAVCVEMECSALFVVGAMRRVRAGAVVAIDGDARAASSGDHDPHRDLVRAAVDREIRVALGAAVRLADPIAFAASSATIGRASKECAREGG
jgi:uridine phosphorylase